MKINNIHGFLAGAALLASGMAEAEAVITTAPGQATSTIFESVKTPSDRLAKLNAFDVAGQPVLSIPASQIDARTLSALRVKHGSNFALTGHYQGQSACLVYMDTPVSSGNAHEPLFNRSGNLASVMSNRVYPFYVVAHEMAHCLNHDFDKSLALLRQQQKDPRFEEVATAISALDMSAREVHADLLATLLGASKTGDWTVLTHAILPLRTTYLDHHHSTVNAITAMIDRLNPSQLKGKSYSEIVALGSQLFSAHFLDGQGRLDPQSRGARNILREWLAFGLEHETYLTRSSGGHLSKDDQSVIDTILLHRRYASLVMSEPVLMNRGQVAFLFALKQVSMKHQDERLRADPGKGYLDSDTMLNTHRIISRNLNIIFKASETRLTGQSYDLDELREHVISWLKHNSHDQSEAILSDAAPLLLSEIMVSADDQNLVGRYQTALRNMQLTIQPEGHAPSSIEPLRLSVDEAEAARSLIARKLSATSFSMSGVR